LQNDFKGSDKEDTTKPVPLEKDMLVHGGKIVRKREDERERRTEKEKGGGGLRVPLPAQEVHPITLEGECRGKNLPSDLIAETVEKGWKKGRSIRRGEATLIQEGGGIAYRDALV